MSTKLLPLLLVAALDPALRLQACSCNMPTICERLDRTPVIFLGEVVEGGVAPDEKPWYSKSTSARLKVIEAFRGLPREAREIDVRLTFIPGMCSPNPYLRGKQVLVFAESIQRNGTMQDGGCTQSASGAQIQEELPMVRSYFRREMTTSIFGWIGPNVEASLVDYVLSTKGSPPLAGATVIAEAKDKKYQAVADANGKYEISGLPGGLYQVHAELPGFESLDPQRAVVVKQGGCSIQNFGLATNNSVEGFVFDPQGTPVRGLNIFIQRKGAKETFGKQATTNARGEFKFTRIDPGEHSVVISPAGETAKSPYPRTVSAVPLQIGPTSALNGVVLKLPPPIPARNIRIHATRGNGQPLTEGYITCSQAEKEHEGYPMSEGLNPKPEGAICRALADRPYRVRLERTTNVVTPKLTNPPEALVLPGRQDVDVHLQAP